MQVACRHADDEADQRGQESYGKADSEGDARPPDDLMEDILPLTGGTEPIFLGWRLVLARNIPAWIAGRDIWGKDSHEDEYEEDHQTNDSFGLGKQAYKKIQLGRAVSYPR